MTHVKFRKITCKNANQQLEKHQETTAEPKAASTKKPKAKKETSGDSKPEATESTPKVEKTPCGHQLRGDPTKVCKKMGETKWGGLCAIHYKQEHPDETTTSTTVEATVV